MTENKIVRDKMPLVSVVVPIYNVELYLKECVDSILSQTYKNIEVILVDDESPDLCGKICDDYVAMDGRIKVVHKKNGGLSDARNAGMKVATGDLITFVDSDDYISKDFVKILFEAMSENNSDIAIANMKRTSRRDDKNTVIDWKVSSYKNEDALIRMLYGTPFGTSACGKLFKRSLFTGVEFPYGKFSEDLFTIYKTILKSENVTYVGFDGYFYYYRDEGSIVVSGYKEKHLEALDAIDDIARAVKGKTQFDNALSTQYINVVYDIAARNPQLSEFQNKRIYSNQTIFNWLYSFHMPLFFLAAGWVYKEKTVLADIKRRIQTIVIPYFSFGFLVLIYWQLMERRFRDSDMSFMDSLFGLFSGCYDNLEFNIHLWFLPCFFVTVILFNILVNLGGRRMAYLVSALMSLAFIVVPMHGLIWGIDRVFKYIGFYAVGVFIAGKSVKAVKKKVKAGIVAIVLLALSFSLSCYHLTMGIMWFVTALIGVAAVILISQLINENRILQYFGRISLIILCIHGPVYRIVVKIVSILLNLGTDAVRENFLLAMVVVVITMAICSTAYEVVVRLAPWMVGKKKVKEN